MANPPIVDIPLLKYTITTQPDPLETGDPLDPQKSKVIITIPAAPDVKCKMISISVPVGEDANTLFTVQPPPSCAVNNPDWSISNNNVIGHDEEPDDAQNFLLEHVSDDKTVNTQLTITIEGIVNNVAGTLIIKISEFSMPGDGDTYQIKQYYKSMAKTGKPAFYLNSFVALNPAIAGHPVSAMPKMTPFQMEWQSNGDTFRIFMDGSTAPLTTTSNKFYAFPRGLTRDANFILEATKDGKTMYQQLSVACANSDFSGGYIQAANDVAINGYTNINGNINMQQSMFCQGASTFHDTMFVDKLQINDTAIAVQKFTCARGLDVVQTTTLQSTIINGNLTVSGHITANGGVSRSVDRAITAASFIETLETALEKSFSSDLKKRLTEILTVL